MLCACIAADTLEETGHLRLVEANGNDADPYRCRNYVQMTSDGRLLYLLREIDPRAHEFAVDISQPVRLLLRARSLNCRAQTEMLARMLRTVFLPCGWTQFPITRKVDLAAEARSSRHQMWVGKRVDAQDSVNNWLKATIVQVGYEFPLSCYILDCSRSRLRECWYTTISGAQSVCPRVASCDVVCCPQMGRVVREHIAAAVAIRRAHGKLLGQRRQGASACALT